MDRYSQASTVAYSSLHVGRPHTEKEEQAVWRLQHRLDVLQNKWMHLPSHLMCRIGPGATPSRYGPFHFGDEFTLEGEGSYFGRLTDLAVRKFQEQADLEVDGKAGINTLGKLNQCFQYLVSSNKAYDA
jgi:peptidoglycan hydrolase-like protein with peptidoglycan-binding domain